MKNVTVNAKIICINFNYKHSSVGIIERYIETIISMENVTLSAKIICNNYNYKHSPLFFIVNYFCILYYSKFLSNTPVIHINPLRYNNESNS